MKCLRYGLVSLALLGVGLYRPASYRPALGLVVRTTTNLTAVRPVDDPGWDYVGQRANASVVYLGDRWVLTASHVGTGRSTKFLGEVFRHEPGDGIQLKNPLGHGLSEEADLKLFRLESEPDLPPLSISAIPPPIGSEVTMIGNGGIRQGDLVFWDADWNEPPESPVAYSGFKVGAQEKRWGTNRIVESFALTSGNGDVLSFRSSFDNFPFGHEAQAAGGDSGGGVFYKNETDWQLLGLMQSVSNMEESGQPKKTAVYGNWTNFADLTQYRDQILEIMNSTSDPELPPWQNPVDPLNVNDDDFVSAADVLAVINELNERVFSDPQTAELPVSSLAQGIPPPFLDVNGDNLASPIDALMVINALNAISFEAPGTSSLAHPNHAHVPEPTTFGLGTIALVSWLAWALGGRKCSVFSRQH